MIDQANVRRQFGDMFQKYFPGQNQNKMFDEEAVKMGYGGQNIEQSQLDDYFRQRIGAGAPPSPVTMERSAPQIPNYTGPSPMMERSAPQVPISMERSEPQVPIQQNTMPQTSANSWVSPTVMPQPSMSSPITPNLPNTSNSISSSNLLNSPSSPNSIPASNAPESMSNQLLSSVRKPGLQKLPTWFK